MASLESEATAMIPNKTLKLSLKSLREFAKKRLPDQELIDLDARDECPLEIVRHMCSPDKLGIQLLFIPEEFGGMGGGTFDVYCVCEEMARIDLGLATSVLATFLGSDPITVGATPEQKRIWLSRIAEEGILFAYGATEPEAGSDLGALRTTAERVIENGKVVGYKITGNKQWISNGGVADAYTILANTPSGPSWFIVEKGAKGFTHDKPEDKHGIRLSNTAALALDNVYVDADRLVGGAEGQGLLQAQAVFGYTRLMVATFGLGGGWSALDRAIPYSAKRIQAGGPLSEKQGYTHKLIVPNVARLEAARAYIEQTADRIDAGEGSLNTEGAIAKYMATEAGNLAADASIQALGGYGYTHEYMVEKIKRDVRITTIYEGTSEIMEMTISRDRWQLHLKTRGQHYHEEALKCEELHAKHPNVGAGTAALALHALAEVMEKARATRLTRHQHILLRLGELIAYAESAGSLARRAALMAENKLNEKANKRFDAAALAAISRIFAREAALKIAQDGMRWVIGAAGATPAEISGLEASLGLPTIHAAQAGLVSDMDFLADALYGRAAKRAEMAA
jgi:alkylation response protein AidB-like acyl-CoA dehydrogenase